MKEWLVAAGIPESEIDTADTEKLLDQWESNYDPKKSIPGMTNARQRYYRPAQYLAAGMLSTEGAIIAAKDAETGALEQTGTVQRNPIM